MDAYFERKKRQGYIFTYHNMDASAPYLSMTIEKKIIEPVSCEGPSWWSHLSGRYRNADEQAEFIASGLVDKKLHRVPNKS